MTLRFADVPAAFNVATHFVDRNVEEGRGERVALVDGERRCTYAQLAALCDRIGNVLLEVGLRREERVMLALGDSIEFVASWYAVLKVGGVTAEVYTFLQAKDYAYYLDYTRATVAIADATTLERMREAAATSAYLRTLLVAGVPAEQLGPGERSLDALLAQAPAQLAAAPTTKDDIGIWKFTTGSTGAPKACVHTHATPLLSFEAYARGVLDVRADDVVLPVPKLFFGYARDLTALYPFGVGGTGIVFADRTTPERIFALTAEHRPTILVNVPTMMRAMLAHPGAGAQDLSCLRLATSAGEALPEDLHRRWLEVFGVEVLDGIGSSEAYHIYVSARHGDARPGTVGRAVPGYRARVVDEEGRDLPAGETGRLWVEGPTAALMYFNAREKSVATFAGELVMSEDLFSADEDGLLRYRGRADDLLKVGGIWVAPLEIEQCLERHPDVLECAVVGVLDDGLQRPRAYVVLRDRGAGSPELAAELRQHVRARLSPHKYPREVRFVAQLPHTSNGKIDRRAVRELVTTGSDDMASLRSGGGT